MPDLTTLQHVKRLIKTGTDDASDDLLIRQLISAASKYVHEYCQRSFVPVWGAREFDAYGDYVESHALFLVQDDLLALTSITNGDGSAIQLSDTVLYPLNHYPKNSITLRQGCSTPFTYDTDPLGAITVTGAWGYHNDYDSAWIDTLDTVQDAPLTAGATAIAVVDADGVNADGQLRFEVLQYLRIEDEVVQVTAINANTNMLTVRRAALGTTAADHVTATPITSYQPMEDVVMACTSLASWLYQTRQSVGEKIQFLTGAQIITNQAPVHIRTTLEQHVMWRSGL